MPRVHYAASNGVSITGLASEIEDFARRWPGSELAGYPVWFCIEQNGDLADLNAPESAPAHEINAFIAYTIEAASVQKWRKPEQRKWLAFFAAEAKEH